MLDFNHPAHYAIANAPYALEQHARLASRSIQQSALAKVLAGETSLDEAIRITQKE
ncbi:MAG: hypothetical protein PHH59_01760 [Methylovulum sp.]|uniref:hypothetical protein n=1 Tax=Methylovulum sp. TaxID=1916980 RepID=UPI002623503F|nr:hypothetical protein [Methylovulum sp.]MDD2722735.1 hypothetical protein [Methylovulum sp.]MDD5123967.1 hypothetical protein [Methylovulum sp.]